MIIVRCLFLMLFATCFYGSNALAAGNSAPLASHNFFTPELKPSPDSFKLAKSTFLPETYDDLGLSGRHNTKYDYNTNDCSAYPLKSCPSGSKCDKCPVGAGYRLNSCTSPYILSGGTCTCPATVTLTFANDKCIKYCDKKCIEKVCAAKSDSAFCTNGTQECDDGCGKNTAKCCIACADTITTKPANSSYTYSSCKDDDGTKNIQTGWACNSGYHKTSSNTCEKDCNVTNCAGYTLSSCPANGTCSTCTKTAANCSTDGTMYRLDSCATGYSKSGDACVKAPATCQEYIKDNFPAYTPVSSTNEIKQAIASNASKIVITKDFTLTESISLSSVNLLGANEIASSFAACSTKPTIRVKESIKTSSNTVINNIKFINELCNKNSSNPMGVIYGAGTIKNVSVIDEEGYTQGCDGFTNSWYAPNFYVSGTMNVSNIESVGAKAFIVGTYASSSTPKSDTLNLDGNITISGVGSNMSEGITLRNTITKVTVSPTAVVKQTDGTMFSGYGTFNINGSIIHQSSKSGLFTIDSEGSFAKININYPITTYRLSINEATLAINSPLTVDVKDTDGVALWSIAGLFAKKIDINAPLTIKNAKNWDKYSIYDGLMAAKEININSDIIVEGGAASLVNAQTDKLTLKSGANIKGIGRLWLHYVTQRSLISESGAKLQFSGGSCKKATSNQTIQATNKSDIDWKSPQAPFTGGC